MEAEPEQATAPVAVEVVYATLSGALSIDANTRTPAETQLREWEKDAAPGFIASLLKIVGEVNAVPEVRATAGINSQRYCMLLAASLCEIVPLERIHSCSLQTQTHC